MSEAVKEVTSALKDIFINPVKEAVIFRAKNNFFGSLVITWIAWNWEKIAFLFMSNMYIAERIDYIKNHFPSPNEDHWWIFPYSHSLIWPVIIAATFTLTYPFFMYILSLIHKSILTKIDTFNLSNEQESIGRKISVIEETEKLESRKLTLRAETNRIIEEDNERTARAKKNITDINVIYSELTEKVNKLTQDKTNLELSLDHQATRMQQATEDLAKLNEKLGPETEREKIRDALAKRIIDQESIIKDFEIKYESALNEILSLKKNLKDILDAELKRQREQDEADAQVRLAKDRIKNLFETIDRSRVSIPLNMRFNYENLKTSLLGFANNLMHSAPDNIEYDVHMEIEDHNE